MFTERGGDIRKIDLLVVGVFAGTPLKHFLPHGSAVEVGGLEFAEAAAALDQVALPDVTAFFDDHGCQGGQMSA